MEWEEITTDGRHLPDTPSEWWVGKYRGDYAHVPWQDVRRCIGRGHPRRGLGVLINVAGVKNVIEHCLDCGETVSGARSKKGIDLASLPLVRDNRQNAWACRHSTIEVVGKITSDGRTSWWNTCVVCWQHLETVPEPDGAYLWHRIIDFRVDEDGFSIVPPCDHCHRHVGTQVHHWAPRALFEDPERWPTANLCVECHAFWHRVVTPAISRRRAS